MALSWKFSGTKAPATVKAGNCPYNFRVPSHTFARLFRGLALTRRFSGGSMTGKANSFGQEALDFVESLDRLDTSGPVLDTMQGAISRFGFEWVAFAGILPKPGETMDDLVLAHRAPDGLHDVYTSRDYIRVDANVRRALHSSRPFEWTWEDYGDEHGP